MVRTGMGSWALLAVLVSTPTATHADWPMPGQNPQRTSCSTESFAAATQPLWHVQLDAYIPARTHIVTAAASSAMPSTVFATAADGIHALNPTDGTQRWFYGMAMPPGDAPSVVDDVVYVAGTDRTIHAIDAINGARLWQTDRAGAPYTVNPLVVGGRVYAGNRDGFFYAFSIADGSLAWSRDLDEPISISAAHQTYGDHPEGVVFVATHARCAHALRADTGVSLWSSCDLPGATFTAFWPVVTGDSVLFVSASAYPTDDTYDLNGRAREEVLLSESDLGLLVDGQDNLDVQHHIDWLTTYPQRRSLLVLDRATGGQSAVAPVLWWGNPGGQRYPPAIAPDGRVWISSSWLHSWFGSGRYLGWIIGEHVGRTVPDLLVGLESADEPEAHAIIGDYIYRNDGGDGIDKGGIFVLAGGSAGEWNLVTFYQAFGAYWGAWGDRKYGNNLTIADTSNPWGGNSLGHHGHQNPPVPLEGRVYFHRSNAVICMEP